MNWKPLALKTIKELEGCRLKAYQCPAKVWTIGFGATGPKITKDTVWTQIQADSDLELQIEDFADHLTARIKPKLNDNQFAALVSFVYNVGKRAFSTSTLLKKLNLGDIQGAADEFEKWVNVKGVVNKGLVNRRAAEFHLFNTKVGMKA